jgi:hypothetical protein
MIFGKNRSKTIDTDQRRKIRLIEGNAKSRHLKKLTCKGTVLQVFIHCIREYRVYLFTQERGAELNQRGATVHKAVQKYQRD